MIELNTFKRLLEDIQSNNNYVSDLNSKYKIDLINTPLVGNFDDVFDLTLKAYFTEEGVDLIYWWLYEDVEKVITINNDGLFKEETKIDVTSKEDLYNYIVKSKLYNGSV